MCLSLKKEKCYQENVALNRRSFVQNSIVILAKDLKFLGGVFHQIHLQRYYLRYIKLALSKDHCEKPQNVKIMEKPGS